MWFREPEGVRGEALGPVRARGLSWPWGTGAAAGHPEPGPGCRGQRDSGLECASLRAGLGVWALGWLACGWVW